MSVSLRRELAVIVLLFCWMSANYSVRAQRPEESKPVVVNGNSNEDSKAALALLAQTVEQDEFVILIARTGNGESVRGLNRRRLGVVRSYVNVTRSTPIPMERIVTAESEPVRGRGRIEVYLKGKLFMVFVFDRNKTFAPEA
jgi:hypothetical protein